MLEVYTEQVGWDTSNLWGRTTIHSLNLLMLFLFSLEGTISLQGQIFRMRLSYLQLRSFCLRFVFLTYGGGNVSKEDHAQCPDGGNRKQKDQLKPNFRMGGTVSKKDQADSPLEAKKTKPNFIPHRHPTMPLMRRSRPTVKTESWKRRGSSLSAPASTR